MYMYIAYILCKVFNLEACERCLSGGVGGHGDPRLCDMAETAVPRGVWGAKTGPKLR